MAELASVNDFNAFRAKNTNNTKERLQHELDYITWAINKEFAGNDAALSTLHGIFEDARKSATKDWPSWTVGASSSAGTKRVAQTHPDLDDSSDDEESQPIGKGKGKAKAPKTDSDTKRNGGLTGLTYFTHYKKNRLQIKELGFGGADTMTTLRFCFDKYGTVEKDAWQRLACVVNFHHDEHRKEVSEAVPSDKVNAALNARWEAIMQDDAQLVDYVTRWEQQDKKNRKVTIPPPALILPHDGPECPDTFPRTDGTVIDYTAKKKYKTGPKAQNGEEYTEQQLANERYASAQERLANQEKEANKIAAGNALANGEDAPAAEGAAAEGDEQEAEADEVAAEAK